MHGANSDFQGEAGETVLVRERVWWGQDVGILAIMERAVTCRGRLSSAGLEECVGGGKGGRAWPGLQ